MKWQFYLLFANLIQKHNARRLDCGSQDSASQVSSASVMITDHNDSLDKRKLITNTSILELLSLVNVLFEQLVKADAICRRWNLNKELRSLLIWPSLLLTMKTKYWRPISWISTQLWSKVRLYLLIIRWVPVTYTVLAPGQFRRRTIIIIEFIDYFEKITFKQSVIAKKDCFEYRSVDLVWDGSEPFYWVCKVPGRIPKVHTQHHTIKIQCVIAPSKKFKREKGTRWHSMDSVAEGSPLNAKDYNVLCQTVLIPKSEIFPWIRK